MLFAALRVPKACPQGIQSGKPPSHPLSEKPRQGALGAFAGKEVVRHRLQDLAGRNLRAKWILGPVPA